MQSKVKTSPQELEITVTEKETTVGKEFDPDSTNIIEFVTITEEETKLGKKTVVMYAHPSGHLSFRFKEGGVIPEALEGSFTTIKVAEASLRAYNTNKKE